MKNTLALIAVAGIASAASAQNFSLSIAGAPATVAEGATFTIDIIGDADVGTHMLGGSFALTSNSSMVSSMTWTNASWSAFNTDGGYAGNGNYDAVIFGQLVIPGVPPFDVPAAGSELGSAIGSFQITLGAGSGVLDLSLVAQDPFTLQTIDVNTGDLADSSQGQLALNGSSIQVGAVPAPSAMALLGLGGLVAGRRRR